MLNNVNKSIIEVKHSELERFSDSMYKSICPVCKTGMMAIARNPDTFELMELDRCFLCGQRFHYIDIKDIKDWRKNEQ